MTRTPIRFLNALFWPVAIWTSLSHLKDHPTDDYVERTSPIAALAIGFWIALAGWIGLRLSSGGGRFFMISAAGDAQTFHVGNTGFDALTDVLMFFVPLIYVAGFWLFTARDERFPR